MANIQSNLSDWGRTLEEIKARRNEAVKEYDDAIKALEKLIKKGNIVGLGSSLFDINNTNNEKKYDFSKTGVYEATTILLGDRKQPLTTKEIHEVLEKSGKKVEKTVLASILYRAVHDKKNSKLAASGRGMWKLSPNHQTL